ncbi:putative indole-3-acetate O-methyltransferase 1-like [Capsicum annuum]|nr:putative indole-3-acetate O-methyltransferase 1-like [Capsicum annuum]
MMDSTAVEIEPEIGSDGVRGKRQANDVELEEPVHKKARTAVNVNTKKVAEIVLVLAAMGKIRGGEVPTDAEKVMMEEAREMLSQVCETFVPTDVFPRDAFGAIIEDLGLNKLKEQRLGLRPPKMSIAEKLMISKDKLEKTVEFSVPAATYSSQRPQANVATTTENRGPSHVRMFPPNKASPVVNPSGSFQSASPLVHGTPASSAPLPYQLPTSEIRPVISGGVVSGNQVRDSSLVALPRVERPSFRMDGRPNGSSHTLQVQGNKTTSGDQSSIRTPTWSVQPASVPAAKCGPDNMMTAQIGDKVQRGAEVKPQMIASRPFITQTTAGNLPTTHSRLQGASFVKSPPLGNTHAEIGKIVQKFLQPRLSERPAWNPPSRDYMCKALSCQMCKSTINEVDNVLVCDACEKGYHLKCLQTTNQKGVPRGEWHCGRCLSMTNGKPLPPKYGRVMRNFNAPKISTIASAVQSSADKKLSGLYEKVKLIANGKVPLKNSPPVTMANNNRNILSKPNMENEKEIGGNIVVSGKENMESKDSMRSCSNNLTVSSSDQYLSTSAGSSVNISCEEKVVELKPQAPVKPETVCHSSDSSQALSHLQTNDHADVANTTAMPSKQFHETQPMVIDAREFSASSNVGNSSGNESNKEEQAVEQINPAETAVATNEDAECSRSSYDHSQNIDWIGNALQVVENKYYYPSCRINGFIYSAQDYALIRFENERLIPSKLLAMWEDKTAGTKWVTVNRCYLARELPQSVGRPCLENNNEVYLSTYSSTVMAGLIQGPCEVHAPRNFTEESERRVRLAKGSDNLSRPLYLCKWIYDESKGLFRDVSFS